MNLSFVEDAQGLTPIYDGDAHRKINTKSDHTKTDKNAFFVNFVMHSPKRYLNEQI